jgi:hypothetical protein
MEQKRWVPDVGVSAGMRKFGWSNERAAIIGVNINIPLFDRNQHGVTAARERAAPPNSVWKRRGWKHRQRTAPHKPGWWLQSDASKPPNRAKLPQSTPIDWGEPAMTLARHH